MLEGLTRLGFKKYALLHTIWTINVETRILVRQGNPEGRIFFFIAGFLQSMSSWEALIRDVWGEARGDTLIICGRRGEGTEPPRYASLLPLWWQYLEVRTIVEHLIDQGIINRRTTIVGHSLGAVFGRKLVRDFPAVFNHLVQIAPTSDVRFALLRSDLFWKNGGLAAIPHAIKALMPPWRGGYLPLRLLQQLFTPRTISCAELDLYARSTVLDSVAVFVSLLFTYAGGELEKAKKRGWAGRTTIIACPDDNVTPLSSIRRLAGRYSRAGIPTALFELAPGTPHCWFTASAVRETNRPLLIAALQDYIT